MVSQRVLLLCIMVFVVSFGIHGMAQAQTVEIHTQKAVYEDSEQIQVYGTIDPVIKGAKYYVTLIAPSGEHLGNVYAVAEATNDGVFTAGFWYSYLEKNPGTYTAEIAYMNATKTVSFEVVPSTESVSIPVWVKQIAKMWSDGAISDDEFAGAIEWLIKQGIIRI